MNPTYIFLFALAIIAIETWLRSRENRITSWEETVRNITLGLNERLYALLLTAFSAQLYAFWQPFAFEAPPVWSQVLLAIIGVDAIWYLYHRSSHRISLLWAAHLTHHIPKEYTMSVAVAASPIGVVVRAFLYGHLALYGISPEIIFFAQVSNALYGYVLHTELWNYPRIMNAVFVTPAFHRIHHSCSPSHIDKNYGNVFTLWDRLFGSYCLDDAQLKYGITKRPKQRDYVHDQVFYLAQLSRNFVRYPLGKALRLLFAGPEAQDADPPNLYSLALKPSRLEVALGISVFILCYRLVFQWNAESRGFWGILIAAHLGVALCSGVFSALIRKRHSA
ncbi:MAG: sterol desaturase family protein [Schleiferiaceae bacterium]|nr:sterol desaturase family protein [Schleiferiaceae bacterium]